MTHNPPRDQQGPGRRSRPEGEESGLRKWRRVDGTKNGAPTGVYRDVSDVEGGERGVNGRGVRRQKRHAARGCRGQEEPGGQVEGNKTASAGKGGVGRQE